MSPALHRYPAKCCDFASILDRAAARVGYGPAAVRLFAMSLVVGLTCVAAGAETPAADVYQIGVAKVDITPDYPIRLNGFGGRREESDGITQRIWAKALAISQGCEPPVVLIAIDSLGVRMTMVDEVEARLERKLGINHGQTTEDMLFSLEVVRCIGCCALAPAMRVAGDTFGRLTPSMVPKILKSYAESYGIEEEEVEVA